MEALEGMWQVNLSCAFCDMRNLQLFLKTEEVGKLVSLNSCCMETKMRK